MEEWYQHEIFTSYLSLEEEITVVYDVIILNGVQESRSFVFYTFSALYRYNSWFL